MVWADKQAIRLCHIQPDKPQRNAYVNRFSRTVQHKWPDQHLFESAELRLGTGALYKCIGLPNPGDY